MYLQTFRPKKRFEPGTMKFNLHKQANASLNSGIDLKEVVKLPPGEDMNDWIAVHGGSHKLKFMGFNRIIRNTSWYITQIQIGIFFHFCFKWLFIYTIEM